MFNQNDAVRLLRDAETIVASPLLSFNQRHTMLAEIRDSLPPPQMRSPAVDAVFAAITKAMTKYELRTGAAEEQGRKASRVQEPTEVASGRAEEAAEAAPRKAEGVEEQAKDTRSVARAAGKRTRRKEACPPCETPKETKLST